MTQLADKIVDVLATVLPEGGILHEPEFLGSEWKYVRECIDTAWVSSVGAYVDRFEADLCTFTGASYAIATVNGTAALHLSLLLAGVRQGDEVVMPALTFVATANAVNYCGAKPHFVDSEATTFGIDAAKLRSYLEKIAEVKDGNCFNRLTGARIGGMVVVHIFGHPADLDPLVELSRQYSIPLIEDAAESLGSNYKGQHTGNHGLVSALSFNGNKIATTGGGGAILTNDAEIAKRAKHLATTAKEPHAWLYNHDEVGYNYRLPNINAALGCAQLEQMPGFVSEKRTLNTAYANAFKAIDEVTLFTEQPFAQSNYWLNALVLSPEIADQRDEVLKATNTQKIMTRPLWTPMDQLPMFADSPSMDLSVARDISTRTINIPSSPKLGRAFA
jgi:perosamine synthetase